MTKRTLIAPSQWEALLRGIEQGMGIKGAAASAEVSYPSALRYMKSLQAEQAIATFDTQNRMNQDFGIHRAIPFNKLNPQAKRALNDISYFAERYFGFVLLPWHIEAVNTIIELYEHTDRKYVVINCPPGVGKTTFFCKVVPLWLTVKDRSLRGLMGSSTQNKGTKLTDALRRELVRKLPVRPETTLVKNGVAVNATGVLSKDFGAFRPNIGKELWTKNEFVVIQQEEVDISEKEPTWQSFGYGSDLIGNRVDFMIWDDLFELRSMKAQESREDLKVWWDSTIESRLEPGGLLILEGQRLHPDDIYRYCLDKNQPSEEEPPADLFIETLSPSEIAELAAERQQQQNVNQNHEKLYHSIKFKAHYEDKCQDFLTHGKNAKPYPEGCLLYPKRLDWRWLAPKRLADPHVWATVYQQEDSTQEAQIFQPIWINGGKGLDGVDYPGCWDDDRGLGEIPPNLKAPIYSVVSVDPSVTNFWSIQWRLVQPETEQRFLIDIYNKRLRSEDFLNYHLSTGEFTGLMEDWQARSVEMGHPITHWIIEHNAAQRWLLAHDYGTTWMRKNNVQIVPHYTTKTKGDPAFGVEALLPNIYRLGKERWPGKGRFALSRFYNELIRYNPDPAIHNGTDDNIMSQWFTEWNMRFIHTPQIVLQRKKKFKFYQKSVGY